MSNNQEEELLSLVKDNNQLLKNIWILLSQENPNDDIKNFIINVIANQIGGKI